MCHRWHQHLHSLRSSFRDWGTEEKPVVRDGFCFGHGPSRTSLQLCWCWQSGSWVEIVAGKAEFPGLDAAVTVGTGQARARTTDAFAKKQGACR